MNQKELIKIRSTNSQQTHENVFILFRHQGHANQSTLKFHLTSERMSIIKETNKMKWWGNQEGSCATRCQVLLAQEKQTTRWAKWHVVLPQTTLGQISIAPWTDWPPTQGKRKKNQTE
jgi:hypothetical protein